MDGETWQGSPGDDHGRIKFGRKAQAWLRRRLECHLALELLPLRWKESARAHWAEGLTWPDFTDRYLDALVDWYMADHERYVRWQDDEEFRGRGYSNGAWVLSKPSVDAALRTAIDAVREDAARARDAATCPTLDDWLRADIAGALAYRGARGGSAAIPQDVRERLRRAAWERERHRLVRCACGEIFTADRRNASRCPTCRARARAEAEMRTQRRAR